MQCRLKTSGNTSALPSGLSSLTFRAEYGVIFLSGDVHCGEISRLETPGLYLIFDLTSSGITQTWDVIEPRGINRP